PSHSSPAHSATTGNPAATRRATSARRAALAASSAAYSSGKPPPTISASVPSGSALALIGSNSAISPPAAASSSPCSAYPNVKAGPTATATRAGAPGFPRATSLSGNEADHDADDSGGAAPAIAVTRPRSR